MKVEIKRNTLIFGLALFTVAILILPSSYPYLIPQSSATSSATIEVVKTIQVDDKETSQEYVNTCQGGVKSNCDRVLIPVPSDDTKTFQHFVKICAGENNTLERPNLIISSDSEDYREQIQVNLPPGFCTHQHFTVMAKDPNSISVKLVETTNFN